MRITWYGHAAFLIETCGTRIILDPFRSPDAGTYAPIDEPADLVVVSHENDRYHSHLGQIHLPYEVVRALNLPVEGVETHGIRIRAIHVFETPERLPEDEVTIVQLEIEGLRIAFLGDLGHVLDPMELAPLVGADIVLVAAGGPPTIELALLPALIEAIGPKLMLPMHYKNDKINLKILPVERFFEIFPDVPVDHVPGSSFEVTVGSLPESVRIVSLQPAR